jgi:[1-hydroxy-2-(trimethylamino)ethyl]phosphonate dioxygenase
MTADFVGQIFAAFAERGDDAYGERVTQLEHALQCAALAEEAGASAELTAAALLHDYGHFFEGRGEAAERERRDARHEAHGARLLARWFPAEVTRPVALHVAAKRYLCAAEPGYFEALSPASKLSLELQGGPFTRGQCARFARNRFATDAVELRRWDDAAKVVGRGVAPLDRYAPLLVRAAAA